MKLKPGWGYWEIDRYPIGGCFRRADGPPSPGKPIAEVLEDIEPPYKGCDIKVRFEDGTTGALDRTAIVGLCFEEPGK